MGMFDTYIPIGPLVCPVDGTPLIEWQGGDGPRGLFVWHEGQRYPTDDRVDEELRRPAAALEEFTLPPEFRIRCWDCPQHPVEALCTAEDGVWTTTRVLPPLGYEDFGSEDELNPPAMPATVASVGGRVREFILVDLRTQMPYIPREARDWPHERLLSWLRVWGEIESVTLRFPQPGEDVYRFHSWAGCVTPFTLTDDGRMFIPMTTIEAWVEPPE